MVCAPCVLLSSLVLTKGSSSSLHEVDQHIVHETLPWSAFSSAILPVIGDQRLVTGLAWLFALLYFGSLDILRV